MWIFGHSSLMKFMAGVLGTVKGRTTLKTIVQDLNTIRIFQIFQHWKRYLQRFLGISKELM